ncbi:MAG: hypothetical protein U9R60_12655 [Bacteroidota bacterium]|nr:hypothetical protein [Bacteroidota bacterium]
MKTTTAKYVLCLICVLLCFNLAAQEHLAMHTGDIYKKKSGAASDTLQKSQINKKAISFEKKFTVSPSRSTSAIYVVAKDVEEGTYTFEIFSLTGQRVYNEVSQLSRNHHKIIDTSFLPDEKYILIISFGKARYRKEISI